MLITANFVDWQHVTQLDLAGTLADALIELDDMESWFNYPKNWHSDSSIQYQSVASVWQKIDQHLSPEYKRASDASMNKIFGNPVTYELENVLEFWFLAISPNTISTMTEAFEVLGYERIKPLFELHCDDLDRQILQDYDQDFLGYIQQWQAAVNEAAEERLGLLSHCG